MKTKNTPGPWKAVERQYGWAIESENGKTIAEQMNNGRDMGESDAKLISTAPDMLELLDFINDAINSHLKINKDSPLHDDIRNVIKRATE
jgi:hypothetical protein